MILAVYKPKGPSSNQLLNQIRKITAVKKIGHAGTLDPLASGVLVVGIGKATKQLGELIKKEKEYLADIKLGVESSTDDEEGEKKEIKFSHIPSLTEIKKELKNFEGEIYQTPPIYSAIKVKGERAYKLARKGESIELKPRKVEIKKIKLVEYDWPFLRLKVITGPGVYVRSLARDLGQALKTGAYLADLERTRVGKFTKKEAIKNLASLTRLRGESGKLFRRDQ